MENSIRKLVADEGLDGKVLFLGRRSDIYNVLKSSDVFVFPSLYEGFGIAVLEAEASGLPVVVSDKVPENVCVVPNVKRLSLDDNIDKWCEAVAECENMKSDVLCDDIYKFDIKNVLKELSQAYREKCGCHKN